jgi:hypothetical protein
VPSYSSHLLMPFLTFLLSFHNMSSAHPTTLIHSTLWIPSQSRPVRCAAMPLQSTNKEESHLASWFFQLGSKHSSLPAATRHTAALNDV